MSETEHDIVVDYKFTDEYWNWYKCVKCGARDSVLRGRQKNLLSFYNKGCIPLTADTKTMYTDVVSDGGMDPRNKNDQSKDEMVIDYLVQKVQELMKLKPTNDREFEAINSFIHSFTDVIWWMQNKK